MTTRGLLDTSTLILLGRLEDASRLPDEPMICTITLAELSVGPLIASAPGEQAARQAHLQQAEADFEPLSFDAAAARAFGRGASSLRRQGRTPGVRAFDALTPPSRCRATCRCTPATLRTSRGSTT